MLLIILSELIIVLILIYSMRLLSKKEYSKNITFLVIALILSILNFVCRLDGYSFFLFLLVVLDLIFSNKVKK